MEELTLEDRVHKLLENLVLEGFNITNTSTWEDMGIDSLDKIELTMDLEDEFNLNIPDEVMVTYLESVEELVGYIERAIKNVG